MPLVSPCISVCVLDKTTGLCFGCYRSIDEVAQWRLLGPDAQLEVLNKLPARMARDDRPGQEERKAKLRRRLVIAEVIDENDGSP